MNRVEGQRSWGWLVVLYVFLAGLGGGTFLFSFIMIFLDKNCIACFKDLNLGIRNIYNSQL